MNYKKSFCFLAICGLMFTACTQVKNTSSSSKKADRLIAQSDVSVNKEEKIPTLSEIISKDVGFTKLFEMVKATKYLEKFKENGPYTVFAPTNGAVEKLSPKVRENLKKPENAQMVTGILNCHIIPGIINKQDILKAIRENNGSVKLRTIGGTRLIASMKGSKIYLIDKNGNAGRLMINDIESSNGIIHTIESVLMAK